MFLGLFLLILPIVAYITIIYVLRKSSRRLKLVHALLGFAVTVAGTGVSIGFAMYGGDQGGISAFFFQLFVVFIYTVIAAVTMFLHFSHQKK